MRASVLDEKRIASWPAPTSRQVSAKSRSREQVIVSARNRAAMSPVQRGLDQAAAKKIHLR